MSSPYACERKTNCSLVEFKEFLVFRFSHPSPHPLPTRFPQSFSRFAQLMAPIFKAFESEDGKPLAQILAHSCPDTGKQYILWQDVQRVFPNVDYLRDTFRHLRTHYMVDQDVKV